MAAGATATITVTGKIGPGNTLTSKVFSNISAYDFDVVNNLLVMRTTNNLVEQVDISLATTVTITLSAAAGNHTVTIS